MKLIANKSVLRGRVRAPGSKSHTIRSVLVASLAEGESEIQGPLVSADTLSAVECYRGLGAEIECGLNWRVKGVGGRVRAPQKVIDVGNSGTTLRFGLGSAALLHEGEAEFTGDEQICKRPVGALLMSLNDLGARCVSVRGDGCVPVRVKGKLRGGRTQIAAVTSQYLSSLLLNAPMAEGETVIEVTQLNERPYVQITLDYLDKWGIVYQRQGWERFMIPPGQVYKAGVGQVPGDFSSATFFFCAGALLDGAVELEGLDFTDAQGDKAVVEVLREMGARIEVEENVVRVRRGELKGTDIDMNSIPDALPALAVTACFAQGPTKLRNVAQARLKETDRIAVMAKELRKLGGQVDELQDGLVIYPAHLKPGSVCGHGDHRVVMALSLAGMALQGETVIDTAEAVNVTFPEYVSLMQTLGAKLRSENS